MVYVDDAYIPFGQTSVKICNGPCGRVLPLTDFSKCRRNRDGLQYRCKTCDRSHNEVTCARRQADPGRRARRNEARMEKYAKVISDPVLLAEHQRQTGAYRQARAEAGISKAKMRAYRYGLSGEAFDAMFASQGKACAGCHKTLDPNDRKTHVDHCHVTGKVRGILCYGCNGALGLARDNPGTLRTLAAYLEIER